MIEIPEAKVVSEQINNVVTGKRIVDVIVEQSPHKFAWFFGNPQEYRGLIKGRRIETAGGCGGMIEIQAEGAVILFGDGVSLRRIGLEEKRPAKHQLLIELEDGSALCASVQMYGGLWCFTKGEFDNKYYLVSKKKPSPLSEEFNRAYFDSLFMEKDVLGLSLKAFLATEQRIPGLGNGVLQDILWNARLHPKAKVKNIDREQRDRLFESVKSTLVKMVEGGGRDTEKDLFGKPGGYRTELSKNTVSKPCTACGNIIVKEAYLGGSIYFCKGCQR